jgi:uncharacterized protein YdhG (YjbR/CyaY superfamily)
VTFLCSECRILKNQTDTIMPRMQEFKTVEEYIASQPGAIQAKLEQLRRLIKKAAPKAEESISYGMPAYKLHGPLVYFGGFKNHIGLYALPVAIEAFKKELSAYELSKGTIRLPQDKPLPAKLITEMIKFRVAQNEEKAAAKAKTKKAKA